MIRFSSALQSVLQGRLPASQSHDLTRHSTNFRQTGWEGSATDARIFDDACMHDFQVPAGKYYLADAGYPLCDKLLVPYRGVRYHLAEWDRASIRCVTVFF